MNTLHDLLGESQHSVGPSPQHTIVAMTKGQQLATQGIEAYKRKSYDEAEPLLMAAFKAPDMNSDGRRTICIYLGFLYRRTARYEDAIAVLEKGLPFPGAFKELIAIHRFLGKAEKKMKDRPGEAECYRKMYSLAKLHRTCLDFRVANWTQGVDWERGATWLAELRTKHGTIYVHRYDGKHLDDGLLSAADYKVLDSAL